MDKLRLGAIFLTCLALLLLVVTLATWFAPRPYPENYGVVIDAGSTKSSIHVYSWDEATRYDGTGNPVREVGAHCKTKKGIGQYLVAQEAADSLKPCLAKTAAKIPSKYLSKTPLFLGATAGMRIVRAQDPTLSEAILQRISELLNRNTSFDVQSVRIITGAEEGLYAWVSANYLSKLLAVGGSKLDTKGALDTGGASSQIAFESKRGGSYKKQLKVYGITYDVYAQSFLCYGTQQARHMYRGILAKNRGYASSLDDPCLAKGFKENLLGKDIFVKPCFDKWKIDYEKLAEQQFTFTGTSDFEACETVVKTQFDKSKCTNDSCSFNDTYLPPHGNKKFIASSGSYYFTAKHFGLLGNSTLEQFRAAVQKWCLLDSSQVGNDTFDREYCFTGTYMYNLITYAYNFNETSWKNIDIRKDIDGTSVGWSLGHMLHQTGLMPEQEPVRPRFALSGWAVLAAITGLVWVLLFVVLGLVMYRWHNAYGTM